MLIMLLLLSRQMLLLGVSSVHLHLVRFGLHGVAVTTYGIVCSLAFVLARRDGASDSRLVRCICSLNNESVKKLQLP